MRAALAAGLLVACTAAPAWAQGQPAALPDAGSPVGAGPPLTSDAQATETLFPGRIAARLRVRAELGPTGRPVRIHALQMLTVVGQGDYSFGLPMPLLAASRATVSESDPGRRTGLLLWQGFSPGRRRLAADITLDPQAAGPPLPVRVAVRWSGGRTAVTLTNGTGIAVRALAGEADRLAVAEALDTLRASLAENRPPVRRSGLQVRDLGTAPRRVDVPLHVEGKLGTRHFVADLGGDKPSMRTIPLPDVTPSQLRFRFTVEPVAPRLNPPAGRNWVDAVRKGVVRDSPRAFLSRAVDAHLAAARLFQYRRFVAGPDPRGAATATYVYVSAPRIAAAAATRRDEDHGAGWLGPVVGGVLAALALGGLAVVWAHS